ncbi:MAG: carbon starvation protein A [Bacteroidales bacterium]|nr:carbon starvation protein A [Bacteroidales bacterium]
MYSFIFCICLLVAGYFFYGKFTERIFGPIPSRKTPAFTRMDGVDYVPMPSWKVYMIQFLNIAGTGPIFGAIMGAKFGTASYIWIVLGCIFAGAVHDYLCGMISVRNDGAGIPEMIGIYMGPGAKKAVLTFVAVVLMLIGAVFVYSPAIILDDLCGGDGHSTSVMIWVGAIFIYYIIATLLPIDKIIGKIYPLFAFALIFMALALMVCLFIKWPSLPEFWDGLGNKGASVGIRGQRIFPCLFITIACGAISGFHSTQSPMMARCITDEKMGRPIFFGAMITEGIIAMIWAAVSTYFFFEGGAAEVGSNTSAAAPTVVNEISKSWLGIAGGLLAILGVVAAPITSGDTVFRSARLIVAETLHISQKEKKNRIMISLPLFLICIGILAFNISDEQGFNKIWRYFGWANQTMAAIVLWMESIYLAKEKKGYRFLLTEIPAIFMTAVVFTYIFSEKIGFNLPFTLSLILALAIVLFSEVVFHYKVILPMRKDKSEPERS